MKLTDASASKTLMDLDDDSSSSGRAPLPGTNASANTSSSSSSFNSPSPSDPHSPSPMDALYSAMESTRSRERISANRQTLDERTRAQAAREELSRQMTRNWKPGDVYAPHDLSPAEMLKWRQPKQPTKDIIDMLGLNPIDHYRVRLVRSFSPCCSGIWSGVRCDER